MGKLLKLFLPAAVLVLAAGIFTSCSDDDDYFGADYVTDTFIVKQIDWVWNADYDRYEYVFPYREIDDYIFDLGTVNGGIYITERGYDNSGRPVSFEVVKPLPFLQSRYDQPSDTRYTSTISFDYTPGFVAFYIQSSDFEQRPELLETFTFKLNVFYR